MAEYIEREALIAEIEKAQSSLESNIDKVWYRNKPYFKGLAWANRLTRDVPAADVVEVRHGEWVDRYGGKYANQLYECSVCKGVACDNVWVDCLGSERIGWALTPYCPNRRKENDYAN